MHTSIDHLSSLLAFGMPGTTEWIILLVLGLLIFGRRLPEVGRSLGRGIVEFKRGIKGIEDDVETESSRSKAPAELSDQASREALPKTEPQTSPSAYAPAETSKSERDA